MKKAKILTLAILVILALVVVFQNTAAVETRLIFFDVTMPRAALLAITLALGFALGLLTSVLVGRKTAKPTSKA